jgi:hypothetical protein
VTIEDLLAEVRAKDRGIGYATVYRTLKLLAECGVASERRFGDGLSRYELADEASTHHDHLICLSCGKITEFEEPRIEELQDEIAPATDTTSPPTSTSSTAPAPTAKPRSSKHRPDRARPSRPARVVVCRARYRRAPVCTAAGRNLPWFPAGMAVARRPRVRTTRSPIAPGTVDESALAPCAALLSPGAARADLPPGLPAQARAATEPAALATPARRTRRDRRTRASPDADGSRSPRRPAYRSPPWVSSRSERRDAFHRGRSSVGVADHDGRVRRGGLAGRLRGGGVSRGPISIRAHRYTVALLTSPVSQARRRDMDPGEPVPRNSSSAGRTAQASTAEWVRVAVQRTDSLVPTSASRTSRMEHEVEELRMVKWSLGTPRMRPASVPRFRRAGRSSSPTPRSHAERVVKPSSQLLDPRVGPPLGFVIHGPARRQRSCSERAPEGRRSLGPRLCDVAHRPWTGGGRPRRPSGLRSRGRAGRRCLRTSCLSTTT